MESYARYVYKLNDNNKSIRSYLLDSQQQQQDEDESSYSNTALLSMMKPSRGAAGRPSVLDVPFVIVNKLVVRCVYEKDKYVPVEIVSHQQIVTYLKQTRYKEQLSTHALNTPSDSTKEKNTNSIIFSGNIHLTQHRQHHQQQEQEQQQQQQQQILLAHPHPWNRKQRQHSTSTTLPTLSNATKSHKPRSILLEMPRTKKEDSLNNTTNLNNNKNNSIDERSEQELKYESQMKWVLMQQREDYVALEHIQTMEEFGCLLEVLMKSKLPLVIRIKLNTDESVTVVYQCIEDFSQDYMLLKIGSKYCLFLEPF